MSLALMQVFNNFVMPATIEGLAQEVAKFNAASRGTIVLSTEGFVGDFLQESFWQSVVSAQRRVDRYAANGTVTPTQMTQGKNSKVKIAGGFGPVIFEPSQLSWLQKGSAEAIEMASRNMTQAIVADMLNSAIAALCAAIGNQAAAVNDVSASAGLSYAAFNDAHAKFGDASSQIIAQVMNGTAWHKLVGGNLTNTNRLYEAGNVLVTDILGRPSIVTDAPALFVAGSPNKLRVLGLTAGAAEVHNAGDLITNIQTNNGKERIETTLQADYTFGLGLKGYTWDEVAGGKSPIDAEIATGTNWDLTANSIKHQAGVMIVANATL